MRVVKEKNVEIVNQKMEMSCEIEIVTRKKNAEMIFNIFYSMFEIEIKPLWQNLKKDSDFSLFRK